MLRIMLLKCCRHLLFYKFHGISILSMMWTLSLFKCWLKKGRYFINECECTEESSSLEVILSSFFFPEKMLSKWWVKCLPDERSRRNLTVCPCSEASEAMPLHRDSSSPQIPALPSPANGGWHYRENTSKIILSLEYDFPLSLILWHKDRYFQKISYICDVCQNFN